MNQMELAKGARTIVELNAGVKEGERVLILTDTGISENISQALACAAKSVGAEVTVMVTSAGKRPGEEPNPLVAAAMGEADVTISPTTRTIYHTDAATAALKKGHRIITLTEITEKILISGGIEADFVGLQPRIAYAKDLFERGCLAHITTEAGTDLTLDMTDRPCTACTGICEPGMKIGIPELEVFVAPLEGTTNGTLVVDACTSGIGLMENPMTLTIRDGKVTDICGGMEAEKLRNILRDSGDENSYNIAEFAIGLNDKAKIIGDIIEDEGAYGTGHFAVGNNLHFGGTNYAPIHLDMVYYHPTIEIDGKVVMEKGVLLEI